jgi:hypothetical protein
MVHGASNIGTGNLYSSACSSSSCLPSSKESDSVYHSCPSITISDSATASRTTIDLTGSNYVSPAIQPAEQNSSTPSWQASQKPVGASRLAVMVLPLAALVGGAINKNLQTTESPVSSGVPGEVLVHDPTQCRSI